MGYEDLRQKVPSLKAPLMIGLSFLFHQYIEHRRNVMRADKFVPQYMRVSDHLQGHVGEGLELKKITDH